MTMESRSSVSEMAPAADKVAEETDPAARAVEAEEAADAAETEDTECPPCWLVAAETEADEEEEAAAAAAMKEEIPDRVLPPAVEVVPVTDSRSHKQQTFYNPS